MPELATLTMPELAATVRPLWAARFSRCNSGRMFGALVAQLANNARLTMSSSLGDRLGFSRTGATGVRFRMASKISGTFSANRTVRPFSQGQIPDL